MKRYMSVRVTICEGSILHGGAIYYSDEEIGLEISSKVSYEDGMAHLRKLEKLLHKSPTLTINQFDRTIAYKELYGYIDRE